MRHRGRAMELRYGWAKPRRVGCGRCVRIWCVGLAPIGYDYMYEPETPWDAWLEIPLTVDAAQS